MIYRGEDNVTELDERTPWGVSPNLVKESKFFVQKYLRWWWIQSTAIQVSLHSTFNAIG